MSELQDKELRAPNIGLSRCARRPLPNARREILPAAHVKQRLATLAGGRMTGRGVLVIDSREHRTQSANRDAARERLRQLLAEASVRPKRRRNTTPTTGSN